MELVQIGVIKSPYTVEDAPRQGRLRDEISEILVFDEYSDALNGLERYKHIIVLYWMHKADRNRLKVTPPGSDEVRGVFATRSPHRPNHIGLCLAEIVEIVGSRMYVRWVDAADNSPLIDIKPYIPEIDSV